MKAMLKKIKKLFAGGMLVLAACNEPYDKDPNEKAAPIVEDVLLRDTFEYEGNQDLGAEAGLFMRAMDLSGSDELFPSSYLFVRFNKLMDGDTLEQTAPDELTGRDLGNCEPVAGVFTVSAGATPVETLKTCYSPSDKLVTVAPGAGLFWAYDTVHTLNISDKAKDKQGRALAPFTVSWKTRAFEVMSVTDAGAHAVLYGVGDLAVDPADAELAAGEAALRLVFTGPVDADHTVALLNAGAKLTNDAGVELTAVDPTGATVRARFGVSDLAGDPVSFDSRVILMFHPTLVASGGEDDSGFAPGAYRLTIPATVTDDGSVMGALEALADPVVVDFTVVVPEE